MIIVHSYSAKLAALGCNVAYVAFGQVHLREMTIKLVTTSLSVTRNQVDFVLFCTQTFCMFKRRNIKPSRLGFVLHSRGLAISGRVAANHVDIVLCSSQRHRAVCLSATAHHVALICCCTHSKAQHVAATKSH